MSTVGNTGTPSQTFAFYGSGLSNVVGIEVAMPSPGGTITDLSAYFSGHGGTITARLCVWDTSGNLLAQTGDISVGAGSGGITGQAWHSGSLTSSLYVASGTNIVIGWWRHSNQSDEWTEQNGGVEWQATDASNTAPGNETFNTGSTGQPGIYATYTPLAAPTISSIAANPGVVGTDVVITGTNLAHTTSVSLNGVAASYAVLGDTSLQVHIPAGVAHPTGTTTVTNPAGTSSGFTYGIAVTPTISSISPNPAVPGGSVTITGTNFTYATSVSIGGVSASFSVVNDTSITATVPGSVSGSVTVTVTDAAGTSLGYTLSAGGVAWAWNGTSWVQGVAYVWSGAAWVAASGVYVNTGTPGSPVWTVAT